MRKGFRTLACCLAAALCLAFWPERAAPMRADAYLSRAASPWEGTLSLWQVSRWRTAGMARSAALNAAAQRVEKRWPGLYIEVEEITPEVLAQRAAQGRLPDALSVPAELSLPEADRLMEFSTAALDPRWGFPDTVSGLPWMASGGLWIHGQDGRTDRQTVNAVGAAQWGMSMALEDRNGLRLFASDRNAYNAFLNGESPLLLGSLWEAASLERRLEAGRETPAWTAEAWPEDDPMPVQFQYFCAYMPKTEGKAEILRALAAELVGDTTQKTLLRSCGVLPVVPPGEDWEMNRYQTLVWDRTEGSIAYPAFGCGDWEAAVLNAAAGEEPARETLRKKLAIREALP